jgi:hypothetical protein
MFKKNTKFYKGIKMIPQFNFQYAEVPFISTNLELKNGEQIKEIEGKKYLCWHDLIDIKVPLFTDPSLILGSRVPTPLHHCNPRSILTEIDKGWWDRTKQRVYESHGYHCACCGVHKSEQKGYPKNIDAHEVYDINWKTGETRLKEIVPLCASRCHQAIHFGRLTAKFEQREIREQTFLAILQHANTLLANNQLPQKNWDATVDDNSKYNVPWKQWHLNLNIEGEEKSFYSLYDNQEDLEAHY